MNCPACGAHNPDAALWCGQCLTDFRPPPIEVEAPPAPPEVPLAVAPVAAITPEIQEADPRATASASGFAIPLQGEPEPDSQAPPVPPSASQPVAPSQPPPVPPAVPASTPQPPPVPPPLPAPRALGHSPGPVSAPRPEMAAVAGRGSVATSTQIPAPPAVAGMARGGSTTLAPPSNSLLGIARDASGNLIWSCSVCSASNSIETGECVTCGASMFAAYEAVEKEKARPKVSESQAMMWGIIPGGGQWVVKRKGEAIGRALLVAWLIGCAVILRNKSVFWVAALQAIGGIAVWVVSALDAKTMLGGHESSVVLTPKRMTLVLVVSIALLLGLSIVFANKVNQLNKENQEKPGAPSGSQIGPPSSGDSGGSGGGGSGGGDSGGGNAS